MLGVAKWPSAWRLSTTSQFAVVGCCILSTVCVTHSESCVTTVTTTLQPSVQPWSNADAAWRLPCHDRRQDYIPRYCTPAWSGYCSAADRLRLDSFLSRCKRFGFTYNNLPSLLYLMMRMILFPSCLINSHHVLQLVLPQQHELKPNIISELWPHDS